MGKTGESQSVQMGKFWEKIPHLNPMMVFVQNENDHQTDITPNSFFKTPG